MIETRDVISRDPQIMSGAVVFTGTRVPVDAFFDNLSDGMSISDFLRNFPSVSRSQIQALLHFASEDVARRVA